MSSYLMTTVRRAGTVAAFVAGLSGCSDLLKVSSPGSLEEAQLSNPALEQFLINGAVGEFQIAYVTYAFWSGVLADEAFTDHSAIMSFRELSLHAFSDLNVANDSVYGTLQRARQAADDATDRVKVMLGPRAASSLSVARALAYGGYAYVLLGEGFCESPVNLSAPLLPVELFTRAIARFDEAIAVAAAADTGKSAAAAKDLIQLAQLGAARASLKKGDLAKARAYAASVGDNYEHWAYYSANSVPQNNGIQMGARPSLPFLGMHPAFQGLNDPRVPQPSVARPSLNAHAIFPPMRPSMFSGWSATTPLPIEVSTSIRFASGLEAQYIRLEADGPSSAMLVFVNARRAVGGNAPVNLSGAALVTEFRVQRGRDFYLTGQRLGDLRRYAAVGTDLFPTGPFPMPPNAPYGAMHCFVVPQSEKATNPHY